MFSDLEKSRIDHLDSQCSVPPLHTSRVLKCVIEFVHFRQDEGEYLLEKGDWKRSDMFFEYRLKEGEELRLKVSTLCSIVRLQF
jgi:hypothetical protein